jgi:hypothetical protein
MLIGALLLHAYIGRPPNGDHEYHLWAIGTGYLWAT